MDAVEGEKSMYTVCAEDLDNQTLTFCFGKAIGNDLGTTIAKFYINLRVVNNVYLIRSPNVCRWRSSFLLSFIFYSTSPRLQCGPKVCQGLDHRSSTKN